VVVNKLVDFQQSKKVQHDLVTLIPCSIWGLLSVPDSLSVTQLFEAHPPQDPELEDQPLNLPMFKYRSTELMVVVTEYLTIQAQEYRDTLEEFIQERQDLNKRIFKVCERLF
jgi:hypothetical protein